MAASKSGKHIYVQGTGNTLASIATDINDSLFCSWDVGSSTLTVFGTAADVRYFRIRNNGELTINDGETLAFSNATNDDTRFYLDAGGHLIMNDASTIDFSITSTRPYYSYFYGKVTCNADIPNDKRPFFNNFYRLYMYETANNNTYVNDIWDFTGAKIGGSRVNNGYGFYFAAIGKMRAHIFKDMIFDETLGDSNLDTYSIMFPYGLHDADNITFENIYFEKVERAFNCTGGPNIKTKGCTFNDLSTSWAALHYSSSGREKRDFFRAYGARAIKPYGQYFAYHEDATFLVGNNNNKLNCSYGGLVMIKDCDFQRTTGDSLEIKYQGRVMQWTGNTFADANPYDVQQGGERSIVFKLDITVEDELGNPIEDAVVHIRQFTDRESYMFTTNSNGKLHAIHDLEGAMLTFESYYDNNNAQPWSTVNQPHSYEIHVPGYLTQKSTIVMDSDKAVTVTMVPTDSIEDFNTSSSLTI